MIKEWWKHVKLVYDYIYDLKYANELKWWAMHVVHFLIWYSFFKIVL